MSSFTYCGTAGNILEQYSKKINELFSFLTERFLPVTIHGALRPAARHPSLAWTSTI
jgi:hypothetical protein